MFNSLPFPMFIILCLILTIGGLYYIKKYKDSEKKHIFLLACIIPLCAIISIILKVISEFFPNLSNHPFYLFSLFFNMFLSVGTVIVIGIIQLRKGQVPPEKKKIMYIGFFLIFICIVFFIILTILMQYR